MPVVIENIPAENQVMVTIEGKFDFSCHAAFRRSFTEAPKGASFVVDLGRVTYMDSAALGMLLLLRDKAASAPMRVELRNSRGQPREVLNIADFGRIFRLT